MKLEDIGFYSLYDERVKNLSLTSQMKRAEIILIEKCNFSCPYCRGLKPEVYGDRKLKQLSLDEIKQNIDYWCENQPLENIRFSGGEPTLHKDIIEIISYAKNKGIKHIAISTNGSNKTELYKQLIDAGCNDFSISLDACCASDGDKMAGHIKGSWDKVVNNIEILSKLTYVTVGVVLTLENIDSCIETIRFAHNLGVGDIRIISAAQMSDILKFAKLNEIEQDILESHPILRYRINNFLNGIEVRGLKITDSNKCPLVLDDSIIAGNAHYPCVIAMREGANPIGKVGPNMRQERYEWYKNHNTHKDEICNKNCLDVCSTYSNRVRDLRPEL
jgi:MoaA/NifB/PqqE/SkfB family radical SAM enzyme